jgi:hypothetical protein
MLDCPLGCSVPSFSSGTIARINCASILNIGWPTLINRTYCQFKIYQTLLQLRPTHSPVIPSHIAFSIRKARKSFAAPFSFSAASTTITSPDSPREEARIFWRQWRLQHTIKPFENSWSSVTSILDRLFSYLFNVFDQRRIRGRSETDESRLFVGFFATILSSLQFTSHLVLGQHLPGRLSWNRNPLFNNSSHEMFIWKVKCQMWGRPSKGRTTSILEQFRNKNLFRNNPTLPE